MLKNKFNFTSAVIRSIDLLVTFGIKKNWRGGAEGSHVFASSLTAKTT